MRSTTRLAAALAAVLACSGLTLITAPAATADAGQPFGSTGDIRVEHRLYGVARVLEAKGITPGAGAEVTVADEVENVASYNGNVEVDIDPEAQTIAVTVANSNCYSGVVVTIRTREITSVSPVADNLWGDGIAARDRNVSVGVVTLTWLAPTVDDCPSLGAPGASATFTYDALPKPSLASVAVTGTTGATTRTVQWSPSPGARVTKYQVTVKRGTTQILSQTVDAATTSLALGTSVLSRTGTHTASVVAVNEAGPGAATTQDFSVTAVAPRAPRSLTIDGGVTSSVRTVKWLAPSFDGRSPITSYRITVKQGATTILTKIVGPTVRSVGLSRSSLAAGSQTVSVAARNAIGTSPSATKTFTIVK